MEIADALGGLPTKRPLNNPCTIALLLAQITREHGADEAARVDALIKDRTRMATVLSERLRANGYRISDQTIRRHRRGICSC